MLFTWMANSVYGRIAAKALSIILIIYGLIFFSARWGAQTERDRANAKDRKKADRLRKRGDAAFRRAVHRDEILYRD